MISPPSTHNHIRLMTKDDLHLVLIWRNHPDIRRHMYTQHEITLEEHQGWFERASHDQSKHLLIFEADATPWGFIQFSQLGSSAIADWGFYVAPDAPRGYGRRLGRSALDYAFGDLYLHKICGRVLAFNERSIRFHRALGFHQEGRLREQHFDGQQYHDVFCFGLLQPEWQPNSLEESPCRTNHR